MRKSFVLAAAVFSTVAVSAQKEKQETIEGNGNLVTKEISVSSFDVLKASGIYELKLSQGDKEGVRIEADENLQQYFNVHNEGTKLVIEMKDIKNKNMKVKNKMRVFVSFKKLKEMDLSMVGNVVTDNALSFADLEMKNSSVGNVDMNLSASNLSLKNSSVGNVKLSGKAENAVVKNDGVGNLNAANFVVQTMKIDNEGVGHAEVNAEKEIKVSDNMLGRVRNRGAATMKKSNKVRI